MIKRIKQYLANRREEQRIREKEWLVSIDQGVWLRHPERYRPIEKWSYWGEMQIDVLSHIYSHFPNSYIYFRFQTTFPEEYTEILDKIEHELIINNRKEGQVSIIKKMDDLETWSILFSSLGIPNYARCVYILDYEPDQLVDTIDQLYETTIHHKVQQHQQDDSGLINRCKCLCYSLDEDLLISKIDLPIDTVVGILNKIAKKHELELIVQDKSPYS